MDRYSPRPPPRSYSNLNVDYSNLNVDVMDGVIRPVPQHSPLTKQVNQLAYEIPKNKYASNPWNYAPEFLKVFGDVRVHVGGRAVFDCVLLGSPRPKVISTFSSSSSWV
ncbi:unnamed protein product [Cylicostephanus goldi]|uniref:Uncharacterized protein n=1 Tax=Cylicostephanus goldi TaxID=71465 RepID=A0A3P6RSI8_CYLGO|nr:unnamed protein product [Cylicostephanus goldi]